MKYELYTRNKAALALMWDFNARNHEVTKLKIKNIRLRERYGEGEVPYEAKTGSGPILLTLSFPYVRDLLNQHPLKNSPDAALIYNLVNSRPVTSDAIWTMMRQLRQRIIRMLESEQIKDSEEKQNLEYLLRTKKWNPYCIRHSAITSDADYLPEFALKKKVRWSMNSKQPSRYIKKKMGQDLKNRILAQNGIIPDVDLKKKPSVLSCPRCNETNPRENKFCSRCSYPLIPDAYDEIKARERKEMDEIKQQYNQMNVTLQNIVAIMVTADESTIKFDLVIFSYVVQHIDPVYYPLIFDFCKQVCNGVVLVDVFWNPSRVMEGEQMSFDNDQVSWYGLSYEELATLVASRFNILSDRIAKNEISVVINMAMTPGQTPFADIFSKQYEYYSGRVIRRKIRANFDHSFRVYRIRPLKFDLNSLPSVKLLESLYPERFDFVKSELRQWTQSTRRISTVVLAAKFLWLCRSNKIPVMLDEVSRDFNVSARVILSKLSEISYVPPLSHLEYVDRILRRLDLQEVQDIANELAINDNLVGCSPAVRACCAILRCCKDKGIELKINDLVAEAHVTPVSIRNVLKRIVPV